MTTTYASPYNGMATQPFTLPTAEQAHGAKQYVKRCVITLAAQAAADVIKLCNLPKGACPMGGELTTDTSLGSATLSIGNASSAAKYRAASTFTATDTPTTYGKASAQGITPLAADEEVIATVGTASLPGSGTLVIDVFYSQV